MAQKERGENLKWKIWEEACYVATNQSEWKDLLKPCVPRRHSCQDDNDDDDDDDDNDDD